LLIPLVWFLLCSFLGRVFLPNGFTTVDAVPIMEAEVLCTITSLKNKHSTGYDGISNKTLKLCGKYIS
jgi:hypothetical protein